MSQASLCKWREQELIHFGLKTGLSIVQPAELVASKRRIRDLEVEVEILRRASIALRNVVLQSTSSR